MKRNEKLWLKLFRSAEFRLDQIGMKPTSNCHLISPNTPQCTRPEWMPTRISTFTAITSRTNLRKGREYGTRNVNNNQLHSRGAYLSLRVRKIHIVFTKTCETS